MYEREVIVLNMLLVFLGCGVGGVFRYGVTTVIYNIFGHGYPHGTLAVNITGSFLMGLLTVYLQERVGIINIELRGLLLVGLLGGYTTFSSFSMDTLSLIETGRYFSALTYILGSVLLCIAGVWAGTLIGRQI